MIRYNNSALPQYTPEPYQSPFAGIWNLISAWYSTSPEFREQFANLFRTKGEPETGFEESFDTTMTYPGLFDKPAFSSEGTKRDVEKILTGTEGEITDWMRPIVVGVRESNDYMPGTSIRRKLFEDMPALSFAKQEEI